MKKLGFALLLCFCLVGCNQKASYQTITASEAYKMMEEDVVILDVRTEEEYGESHIARAINLPLHQMDTMISSIDALKDKSETILVYCASGKRSKEAASKLAALGYTNVYDFGGLSDWTYGVVKANEMQ